MSVTPIMYLIGFLSVLSISYEGSYHLDRDAVLSCLEPTEAIKSSQLK